MEKSFSEIYEIIIISVSLHEEKEMIHHLKCEKNTLATFGNNF